MPWKPRTLSLMNLEPSQGKVGNSLSVTARGQGFGQGIQLILIRQDVVGGLVPADVLPCNSVSITTGSFELSFKLSLDGVTPGTYCAIAWNLPLRANDASERYVLENAFIVQSA
jgi:hypothetical protein